MVLKNGKLLPTLAKNVHVNDMMKLESEQMKEIVQTQDIVLDKVIHVSTKSGLMYANSILTTGICEKIEESFIDSNVVLLFSSSRQYPLQFNKNLQTVY